MSKGRRETIDTKMHFLWWIFISASATISLTWNEVSVAQTVRDETREMWCHNDDWRIACFYYCLFGLSSLTRCAHETRQFSVSFCVDVKFGFCSNASNANCNCEIVYKQADWANARVCARPSRQTHAPTADNGRSPSWSRFSRKWVSIEHTNIRFIFEINFSAQIRKMSKSYWLNAMSRRLPSALMSFVIDNGNRRSTIRRENTTKDQRKITHFVVVSRSFDKFQAMRLSARVATHLTCVGLNSSVKWIFRFPFLFGSIKSSHVKLISNRSAQKHFCHTFQPFIVTSHRPNAILIDCRWHSDAEKWFDKNRCNFARLWRTCLFSHTHESTNGWIRFIWLKFDRMRLDSLPSERKIEPKKKKRLKMLSSIVEWILTRLQYTKSIRIGYQFPMLTFSVVEHTENSLKSYKLQSSIAFVDFHSMQKNWNLISRSISRLDLTNANVEIEFDDKKIDYFF